MENTDKILFEDDSSRWYVAMGERWLGPMAASDVYERIQTGELTWAHFIWTKGQSGWLRICDTPTFRGAVPEAPSPKIMSELKENLKPQVKQSEGRRGPPSAPSETMPDQEQAQRMWFLYYNEAQFGPFSTDEVRRYLHVGKIHGKVHAWRDGMNDWERLANIELFEESCRVAEVAYRERKGKTAKSEQRQGPRRPLVARITLATADQVIVGVCRDISVGGMQVLTDHLPGDPGARIRLNVSPSGPGKIDPFVAEGVVVRILEDGRGFSFRFDRLPEESRQAIEQYINPGRGQ